MNIKFIIVLLFGSLVRSMGQPVAPLQRADYFLKDLEIIKKSVDEIHPGLNRFQQQSEFNAAYDSIFQAVKSKDSLSSKDFFLLVNPLITKIKCGHIKFMPSSKNFPFFYNTNNVLPLIVRFDDQKRLLIIKSKQAGLAGKYIENINGQAIDEVLKTLRSNMMVDGNSGTSADAQIEQYFSAWYADFVQKRNEFAVEFTDYQSGERQQATLQGISDVEWLDLNKNVNLISGKNELIMKSDSVAYLRVATFYSENGNKEFLKFLAGSFEAINRKPVKHLVIDVRDNEGGNDALGKELFGYIALKDFRYYDRIEVEVQKKKKITYNKNAYFPKFIGLAPLFIKEQKDGKLLWKKHQNLGVHKPKKNAYQGDVSFLMNGLSFSVTSEFLSVARSENRGTFIGTESGGGYTGDNSGTFVIFNLPASGLQLGIPVAGYYLAVLPPKEVARGVMPDLEIMPTSIDLIHQEDTVLNTILKSNR